MIIIFTEEELESVAELPHRLQKSASVKNIWISHLLWRKPRSCPKFSLQDELHDVAVWRRRAHSPICQHFRHTHVQFSRFLISAWCTLSLIPLWWCHCILLILNVPFWGSSSGDMDLDAHMGSSQRHWECKTKIQRGPFHCLTTVLRILMIIATSDIVSSLFVQHHLDWRWITARSAPFARSQVFCRVYFNSLPFVWLWLIRHASGAASARLCVHVGVFGFRLCVQVKWHSLKSMSGT